MQELRTEPRQRRSQQSIDSILDAAERVIARDGSGASIEAIAIEAGVTKPIVYARVGARAELCEALAERLAARLDTAPL